MKRFLFIVIIFVSAILQAHEVSFIYSVIENDLSNQTVEKGWNLNFLALRWGNNDFSNYALSFSISEYSPPVVAVNIDQAWLRFPLYKDLNLLVGKQIHDFSSTGKSGFC